MNVEVVHDASAGRLAFRHWFAPQVAAVQLEQIEGIEDPAGFDSLAFLQSIEDCQAGPQISDLAIDDAGAATQR